jgi:hypothetical protein
MRLPPVAQGPALEPFTFLPLFRTAMSARLVLLLLAALLLPLQADAQLYPMPGSSSEDAVPCSGCAGTNSAGLSNDGLPTYPYAPPLVDFVGRYVDSQKTANYQHIGFRTARARQIRAVPTTRGQAPPRIYILIGNGVGAYPLDTFFSQKLPAGPISVGGVQTGSAVAGFGRSPLEKITMWDSFMYPEATASGWSVPFADIQDPYGRNGPFDLDDRGYLYGTWTPFGWGIAVDDGRSSGVHFPKVVQMVANASSVDQSRYPNTRTDTSGVSPQAILAVREGAKYYVVTASGGTQGQAVFDVTNPATPILIATYAGAAKAMLAHDRSDATGRVAYIDGSRALQVYSYADLLTNGPAVLTATSSASGGFRALTFDASGNIWLADSAKVTRYAVAGSGYVATEHTFPSFEPINAISVAGGYLAVTGIDWSGPSPVYDVRVARIDAGGVTELDIDGFFRKYYHGALPNFAEPGAYTTPSDVELVSWGGKTYLMYSANGLGDVYELSTADTPPGCAPPSLAYATLSGSASVCPAGTGGTASVTTTGDVGETYQWGWRTTSVDSIQPIAGATASVYQLSAADLGPPGGKQLVVTVTSECGVPRVSNALAVTVLPTSLSIGASSGVYASSTQNTASVTNVGPGTYSWAVTNGTIESGQGTDAIRYTAGPSGDVELSVEVVANGCTWNAAATVPTLVRPPGATMLSLITPCRLNDTRDSTPVASDSTRTMTAGGLCGIPADAKSIAANLTVVSPSSAGWLALHAADAPWGGTSTLNYRPGRTRANSAIVPLSGAGQLVVRNEGSSVHVIVDVTGYFR